MLATEVATEALESIRKSAASLSHLLDEYITSGSLENARDEVQRGSQRQAIKAALDGADRRPRRSTRLAL